MRSNQSELSFGCCVYIVTPQATLFNDQGEQLITHFSSPNPVEGGTVRVTWQDSRDTSSVWAKLVKAVMVRDDSIAWVLLKVKDTGTQAGPTGDRMTKTTFIQRVNTVGGLAPAGECLSSADLGHQAFVPYRADYFFYKKARPATNIPCSCTIEEPDGHRSGSIVVTGDRCASERLIFWRASSLQYQLDFKRNELTDLGTTGTVREALTWHNDLLATLRRLPARMFPSTHPPPI